MRRIELSCVNVLADLTASPLVLGMVITKQSFRICHKKYPLHQALSGSSPIQRVQGGSLNQVLSRLAWQWNTSSSPEGHVTRSNKKSMETVAARTVLSRHEVRVVVGGSPACNSAWRGLPPYPTAHLEPV